MATALPRIEVPLTLGDVARDTGGTLYGAPGLRLRGLGTDTRSLHEGALFVALKGDRFDGHDHLAAACAKGAGAVLVRRGTSVPDGVAAVTVDDTLVALGAIARAHALRTRANIPVVAISGAVGKTTTKELTAAALAAAVEGPCHATAGNLNNLVGAPFTLLALTGEHRAMVVECGSNAPGEIDRIAAMAAPHVALCMNADIAHTEGMGSIEAVADEEGSVYRHATRALVGNADEPLARARMALGDPSLPRWLFGRAPEAHVRLVAREALGDGRARLRYALRPMRDDTPAELTVVTALLGEAAATNIAAALCVTASLFDAAALARAAEAVGKVPPVPGRLVPVPLADGTLVIDDTYNASPRAVRAALDAARELAASRKARLVVALGDMLELGDHGEREHRRAGALVAEAGAGALVAVGPLSRFTAEEAARGGVAVSTAADSAEGARALREVARSGDVVLVKGSRGMRMERCVAALTEAAK
ncbi:MAG: UDP-N-acetylmuramoyl-tripeptide--D-alanyl-D-alanine ligase [Polyangiales bacterium]